MSKTIQVRVDDFLKQSADELFNSLGLDTSTAIRIFLTIAIENGGIPFEIKKPNSLLKEALKLYSSFAIPFAVSLIAAATP